MDEFFRTRMGHKFFEGTLPRIAQELGRLADSMAGLNETARAWLDDRGSAGPRRRPRVLLVDDEPRILQALARALKQEHDVLLATSLTIALALLDAHDLDAVITDHDLQDEHNGVWLLEKVRERCPEAKRILTSGQDRKIDEHLESGLVQRFLPKPASPQELLDCLREVSP